VNIITPHIRLTKDQDVLEKMLDKMREEVVEHLEVQALEEEDKEDKEDKEDREDRITEIEVKIHKVVNKYNKEAEVILLLDKNSQTPMSDSSFQMLKSSKPFKSRLNYQSYPKLQELMSRNFKMLMKIWVKIAILVDQH
jgi:hypothetical protein